MIKGEEVIVIRRVETGASDSFGAPLLEDEFETVADVLISPTKPEDVEANNRLHGSLSKLTAYWPKGYGRSLRGASVEFDGELYRVIGDPAPYTEANVPGAWSMVVYLEVAHG